MKKKRHTVKVPWDSSYKTFRYGNLQMVPYQIAAGESVKITTEWNWFEDPNAAKDWSVTVWGAKAAVGITHDGGLTTQSMPQAPAYQGQTLVNTVTDSGSGGGGGIIVPSQKSEIEQALDNAVAAFNPNTKVKDCLYGSEETYDWYNLPDKGWQVMYKNVMKIECPSNYEVSFRYLMKK